MQANKVENEDGNVPSLYNQDLNKEENGGANEKNIDLSDSPQYPQGFRLTAVFFAIVLSVFFVALDRTIIATAIPRITDEFHSLDEVGWYGSSFFLTLAAFQSTWGKVFKYFPMKPTFLLSIFIFE